MLQKLAVVAFKAVQPAVVEVEQPIDGSIEEIAVVRHHHHTAAEVFQKILQHAQGLHIKVIGGFIQKENIRGLDQQATEGQPPAFTTREFADGAVLLRGGKEEAFEQLGSGQLLVAEIDA